MTKSKGYELAWGAACDSTFYRSPTGCVAIYKGSVLAFGWNCERTSPLQARFNKKRGFDGYRYKSSLHAEMMVVAKIRHLDIDFSKVKIFVWRGRDINHPQLSKPCAACEAALRELGIKRIYYTGNGSFVEEVWRN